MLPSIVISEKPRQVNSVWRQSVVIRTAMADGINLYETVPEEH